MKLQFIGATHGVTGSVHLLQACGKNILIDYGMRQGQEEDVDYALPISAAQVDAVLVTHSHIDHTGYLPLLAKGGYDGPIFFHRGHRGPVQDNADGLCKYTGTGRRMGKPKKQKKRQKTGGAAVHFGRCHGGAETVQGC